MSLVVQSQEEEAKSRRSGRQSPFMDTDAFRGLSRESQAAVLDNHQRSAHERLGHQFGVRLTPLPTRLF